MSPLCLPFWDRNLSGKLFYITQKHLHVLPKLTCLRRPTCLSSSPVLWWKFGYDCWAGSKRRQNYTSSFWLVLFSSWTLHNVTYCVGFDESCVPANIAWAICSPEETCNFCSIGAKISISSSHENWTDDKPPVRPDRTAVSEDGDEDDQLLVQLASRDEPLKRESAAERRVPAQVRGRKELQSGEVHLPHLKRDVSGNSRERSEEFSGWCRNPDGEVLQNIINELSGVRNLKGLHLKHHHVSSAQFKRRTTHLATPGKVNDLYQHVVKMCPFCETGKISRERTTDRRIWRPYLHVVLDLGWTRSVGSRAAIKRFQKHALYCGITREFCRCNKSFVFANSETETCWESCIIRFPTTPPCSARVDVLEKGCVPTLFSRLQINILVWLMNWIRKETKITCLTFGLYSSPAECSAMGHIVLDLTSLAYPKRHVTFPLSEQKLACPAHTRELDEDEDDEALVCPDHTAVVWRRRWSASVTTFIQDRVDKKKSVHLPQSAVFLHNYEEEKGLQSGETHLMCH